MPKLSPNTQADRRGRILDAAEICFARRGFHAATVQDICHEAGVSAGALYLYFASKEALIAGIAERDRAEIARDLAAVASAPDLMAGLSALGAHYLFERPAHKPALMIEIGAESTRNPTVAAMCREVEATFRDALARLFENGKRTGQVSADVDCQEVAALVAVLGDGLFWRKAIDPRFQTERVFAQITRIIEGLLRPSPQAPSLASVPLANTSAEAVAS